MSKQEEKDRADQQVLVEMWTDLGCPWCYVGKHPPVGMPSLPADEIAARYWDLYTTRATHELVVEK